MDHRFQQVVLVNEQDEEKGTMEKMEAHRKGALHRAFSIFLFDSKGNMLIQQRAAKKYHSGSLWTNTCCSHPYPGEAVEEAAARRLFEEMGIATALTHAFSFLYRAEFDNGLTEHEYDHVFTGVYEGEINANSDEVASYTYKPVTELLRQVEDFPQRFTPWFKIALPRVLAHMQLQATA